MKTQEKRDSLMNPFAPAVNHITTAEYFDHIGEPWFKQQEEKVASGEITN